MWAGGDRVADLVHIIMIDRHAITSSLKRFGGVHNMLNVFQVTDPEWANARNFYLFIHTTTKLGVDTDCWCEQTNNKTKQK